MAESSISSLAPKNFVASSSDFLPKMLNFSDNVSNLNNKFLNFVDPQITSTPAKNAQKTGNLLALIFWFIIIAIIVAIILSLWNPPIVQKNDENSNPTGDLDPVKVILGALIVALIVIVVIYLIRSSRKEDY